MAAQRDLVHFLPADVEMLGDEFRRVPHNIRFALKKGKRRLFGVHRAVFGMRYDVGPAIQAADHIVDAFVVLQAVPPPGARQRVRRTGHMLYPAGQDDIGHAGPDHCHPRKNGLHAGNADPVDRHRRHRFRYAGQKRRNASHI